MGHEIAAMTIGRKVQAKQVQKYPDWGGREVWALLFYLPGEEVPCTGYPQFIVFSDTGYHITEADEAIDYLDYIGDKYGFDEDDDIIGFDMYEPIAIE